jgi:hypothetical protein
MRDLRQSTAVTVKVGPLTDSAGDPLTTLTITKADLRLTKNGGDLAAASADQGASDVGAPHDELGAYDCSLNTTDTNTLGHLRVIVRESGQIVAWEDFNVKPAQVWDSEYSTDLLQVDAREFAGQTITAAAGVTLPASVASPTNITAGTITTVTNVTNAPTNGDLTATMKASINTEVDAALDTAIPGSPTANSINERIQTMDNAYTATRAGYLDNLSAGAVALASSLATLAGKFTGITLLAEWLGLIAGKQTGNSTARTELRATGAGSGTYDETNDSLEAMRDAGASPGDIADAVWDEATSGHQTAGTTGKALTDAGGAGTPPTAAEVADAVWDEALAGHTTSGTAGERLGRIPNAAAGANGGLPLQGGAIPNANAAANGGLPTVNGSNYIAGMQGTINTLDGLDTAQDAQHTATLAAIAALNDLSSAESQAAAEAALTAFGAATAALFTSTGRADPSALAGALASSLSPLAKLDWILARVMRPGSFNKTTGADIVKNAAGTDIAKATAADDGTTTSRGAFGAP